MGLKEDAKIILDKNLESEVQIDVDQINERVIDNVLNSLKTIHVAQGSVFPEIPDIQDKNFTTIEVNTDDGISLPIVCDYNKVTNFVTQYYEQEKIFSYNVDFGYEAE